MLDERIARVKELIAQREEIDAELKDLLGISSAPPEPRTRRCSKCGQAGHRATACPQASGSPIPPVSAPLV